MSGEVCPFSHLETAALVTPRKSASSSWVILRSRRRRVIFSDKCNWFMAVYLLGNYRRRMQLAVRILYQRQRRIFKRAEVDFEIQS